MGQRPPRPISRNLPYNSPVRDGGGLKMRICGGFRMRMTGNFETRIGGGFSSRKAVGFDENTQVSAPTGLLVKFSRMRFFQ